MTTNQDFDEENNENSYEYNQNYVNTRIKRNKQERAVRRLNMWQKRFRFILHFVTILVLILLCYKLIRLPQWYMSSKAFDSIKSPYLEILNNKIVPDYYILAALRKSTVPTVPIYMYNTNELKNNLLELDPIENVFIRRFWFPARLQIIIQESTPIITIAPDEKVAPIAFFTDNYKLIGRDYMPLNPSYKTVRVLTYGTKGDDYRHWEKDKIEKIIKISKTIKTVSKEPLDYIDLRTPSDVYLQLHGIKIRLGALDDTCYDRIKRLPSIMPQVQTLDKKIKYIDLRWKNANYIKLEE